ncbi:hypothetical protein IU459_02245 [Nocardia amamiensis]|uniref:DUF5666 domain-containing protein n=1 Tax=Nocardia amamiensis TaxID=404578 RepID=A0ABS0CJH0_9NOCA|nr:DUF5666 domain-containing protein [Nocardia amamiensis]MBF6296360.1 hypothetical protein [Nocardia amamiensis]
MTNPNDPWGQRPEDAPTEYLGPPGKSGYEELAHTEAYGTGAPSEYPPTQQYGGWAPPGPNATREFPSYDAQWAAYQGGGDNRWPGTAVPPGGGAPPEQPRPPRRNTGLWIALGLGVVLLIGAVGVAAGLLLGGSDSGSSDTAAVSSAPVTTRSVPGTRTGAPTPPSGLPGVPGLGDVDGLGATMGTITANDGGTLTVSTVLGDTIAVRTDANTQVISLSGTKVSDLPTGELVLIQGDKAADGSIQAKVIIGTSLPGGPR